MSITYISREKLWDLIKKFVDDSSWKTYGFVTNDTDYNVYKSTQLSGSYRGYTSWLCFTYKDQRVQNGIYIGIYANRVKVSEKLHLNNIEICYAISENNTPKQQWNKPHLPYSTSAQYRHSRCAATYRPQDFKSDVCKTEFLNMLDNMIDEYIKIFEKKYISGPILSGKHADQTSLDWVEEILGRKLTDEQKKVVELDYEKEDIDAALVVASAGCGKSTTLLGHTLNLIAEKKIQNSNDALLVVFNRENRKELQEKVDAFGFEHLGASIHTFHSLGLNIVQERNPQINSIDPDNAENPFDTVLDKYTDIKNPFGGDEWIKNLWRFGTDFAKQQNSEDIYQNEIIDDELRKKVNQLESAGFSIVSTDDEKDLIRIRLLNFLALRNIKYIMQDATSSKCSLISATNTVAHLCWSLEKANSSDILLENFNADTFSLLEQKLESLGFEWQHINETELKRCINATILKARSKIFQKTAQFFITVFKIKYPNGSVDDLEDIRQELISNYAGCNLEQNHINAFFDLLIPVYRDYQEELVNQNKIDFNDMLNQAINYINKGMVKREYKYILVDEFQDVAEDNFKLIQALQEKTGAKLMCVGDDWQSIYAWRGSDLEYFENFNKYFPKSKELYINQTFRNGQELVKIAAEFVSKDKHLKKKNPSSKQPETKLIPFYYNSSNKAQNWKKLMQHIYQNYNLKEVLFLGRYKNDVHLDYGFINQQQFMTIHKSKGLEKDVVVILNLSNTTPFGFPSQVKGDIVFDTLYENREEKAKAEERRLFYVALTRAKKACFLWIPEKNASDFVKEIGFDYIQKH